MALMILRHIPIFCCPVQPEDEFYYRYVDLPMLQFIVCTYFFYSGYGIMCSLQTKGKLYLRQLLTKRFAGLYIRFGFAAAIACMFTALITGDFSAQALKFLHTMVGCGGWWFIVMSLLLYLLTWFSFMVVSSLPECRRSFAAIAILFILVAITVSLMYPYKAYWWVDTEWCFPAGMLYCTLRHKIEDMLGKSRLPCLLCGGTLILASVWALNNFHLFAKGVDRLTGLHANGLCQIHYTSAMACVFAMGVTWLFAAITWERIPAPLMWMGRNAFYLFLFQYVPMHYFRLIGLPASHPRLSILLSFVSAIALAGLMKWIFAFVYTHLSTARQI